MARPNVNKLINALAAQRKARLSAEAPADTVVAEAPAAPAPAPADSGTVKPTRDEVRAKRYPSQEKHAARRTAAMKETEGGKVVEKVKEASKRAPLTPLAGRAVEQNGIKAPLREGAIATCWALFDEHPETTGEDLVNYCEGLDLNLGNMKIEFYRWRRFNGLVTPRAAK